MIKAQFASWPAKKTERPRPSVPRSRSRFHARHDRHGQRGDALHRRRLLSAAARAAEDGRRLSRGDRRLALQRHAQRAPAGDRAATGRAVSSARSRIRGGSSARRTCTSSPRSLPTRGVEAGLRAVVTEGERVAQHGFTATELDRAKREMLRGMESAYAERDKTPSASFVSEYEGAFLEHTAMPSIAQQYALYQQLVPGIQLSEVNALAHKWLSNKSRVIVVNAPQKAAAQIAERAGAARGARQRRARERCRVYGFRVERATRRHAAHARQDRVVHEDRVRRRHRVEAVQRRARAHQANGLQGRRASLPRLRARRHDPS